VASGTLSSPLTAGPGLLHYSKGIIVHKVVSHTETKDLLVIDDGTDVVECQVEKSNVLQPIGVGMDNSIMILQ